MNGVEPKYYTDDGTKLICQYCLSEYKTITPSHLKFHDMTMEDYKNRFPDAPLKMPNKKKTKSNHISTRENLKATDGTLLSLKNMTESLIINKNIEKVIKDETVVLEETKEQIASVKKEETKEQSVPVKKEETKKRVIPIKKKEKSSLILVKDKIFKIVKEFFPNIKKNYVFKKTNVKGNILYTVLTDFGDPSEKIMFDFSGMAWNIKTPLMTKYHKKELLEESRWQYVDIKNIGITELELREILNSL